MESRVGQQLGHYRLLRLLGQGAFADVYLAENLELNLMVAIKILQRRLVGEADLESFRREAQTVAQLRHPNIVRIFDFDVQDGSPLLIMEYAPGGSLRHRHPEGTQLLPAHVVPYVQQAANALHYAHSRRLVHRDVKPENMLLGPNNEVLLSDFGLVQMVKSSSKQSTKEMAGTVLYMAPEQIQGKPRPASDQYALGAVTYEWLTGEPPFQGSFPEIATQHLFATPLPLCSKVPQIPPALEHVVLRSLAKEPQQRFADIEEFALAVEQASQPTVSASFDDARDPWISPSDEAYISTFVKQPSEPSVLQFPPLIPQGVSPSTQFVSADDAETRINSPSRTASSGLSPLQSSQDPLMDLSTVDMSKQEEDGGHWMNLRWPILACVLLALVIFEVGYFFQQPPIMAFSVILALACLVLGVIQTMHFNQWFWLLGFVLLSPLTAVLYGVFDPHTKPKTPANLRQLVIVTSCLGYMSFGSSVVIWIVTNNGWAILELILLYFGITLVLAGWLLGWIRATRLKLETSRFRSASAPIAGIMSIWNDE